MKEKEPTKQILENKIKVLLAIISTIIILILAALGLAPEKQCLQGHYKTIKDSYTSQPKNIWVCDKYFR
jgi:hypothetical protein